ncbi:DUF3611 family protein [Pantanalinema rosaneae CENA516]|uniref:DUF3611 family protein n=1 Tax=Pantanalinema rosaneae TaxID=1620701 RepID=UPI003D6F5689
MSNILPEDSSVNLQKIAKTFRQTGWISFWVQLVLTVISTITLVFAAASGSNPNPATGGGSTNPGTGIGGLLTILGIAVLAFNMYWALTRYVAFGRRLSGNKMVRPRKSETIQAIRFGLTVSLVGMLLAILGAETIVGLLVGKALSQGIGGLVAVDPSRFIQPADTFVVQASINVILAQFAGIVAALWLLNRMSK